MSSINPGLQLLSMASGMDANQAVLGQTIARLSSGSRIQGPADDPAGAAETDALNGASGVLGAASTNVQDAISYAQSADGYLGGVASILDRMGELASYAQNPVASASDVSDYQGEFSQLQDQLRSVIGGTAAQIGGTGNPDPGASFDGQPLFGPTASGGMTIDAGQGPGDQVRIPDVDLQTGALQGVIQQDASGNFTLSVTSAGVATSLSNALQQVASGRATLGGAQSSLSAAAASIASQQENTSSASAGISDADVAAESTQLATSNILLQSGAAMLAQANQNAQAVLKLIRS
jgi:flagellin